MAVIFEHGYEDCAYGLDPNTGFSWTGTVIDPAGASLTCQGVTVNQETRASESIIDDALGGRQAYAYFNIGSGQTLLFTRIYFLIHTMDMGDALDFVDLIQFVHTDAASNILQAMIYNNGDGNRSLYFRYADSLGSTNIDTTIDPALDTWYCLEIAYYSHAVNGYARLWLNDILRAEAAGIDTSAFQSQWVTIGLRAPAATSVHAATVYDDCIIMNDATRNQCKALFGGGCQPQMFASDIIMEVLG